MSLLGSVDPTYDAAGNRVPHAPHHPLRSRPKVAFEPTFSRNWLRGRFDGVFWAEHFWGVRLHRDQRRFVRMACLLSEDDWHVLWRTICVSAGNRAGKTLCLAIIILHHAFYKFGLRPPNPDDPASVEAWAKAPYNWYHVSYQQTIPRNLYREIILLLAGDHPSQGDRETGERRGCPLTRQFPAIAVTDKVFDGLYEWVKIAPAFGGAEIHFRNTNEKAKSLLGINMNGISFDEAGFELYLDEVVSDVLDARRGTTGGPMYFISTPDAINLQFPDLWEEGNPASPNRRPKSLSLRMSTRSNIGYGMTQGEFDDLVAGKPKWWIDQHIDGLFIQVQDAYFNAEAVEKVFYRELPEEARPLKAHRYIQGCDVGIRHDPTWVLHLDYTRKPYVGVRVRRTEGSQTVPAVVNLAQAGHILFNAEGSECATVVDSTGMGGQMFREAFSEAMNPVYEFNFAGQPGKKVNLLGDLHTAIDKGWLKLPREGRFWAELRRQLLGYRLTDSKITQDGVMALAIALYHALRNTGDGAGADFDFFGGQDGVLGQEDRLDRCSRCGFPTCICGGRGN